MKNRIDEIVAEATSGNVPAGMSGATRNRFLRSYYDRVPPDELTARAPRDLAGAALAHLMQAAAWRRGRFRVHVFNPSLINDGWESTHTIVQAITLNRPYLVDTLTMVINEHGFSSHIAIHPTIDVQRDASRKLSAIPQSSEDRTGVRSESFIHIEIDRETDASQLQSLRTQLEKSLGDVAAAVEDWPRMLDRIGAAAASLRDDAAPSAQELRSESAAFLHWVLAGNMTVLGLREYVGTTQGAKQRLRIKRGSGLGILRNDERADVSLDAAKSPAGYESRRNVLENIVLMKSDSRSTVHRGDYLDYIGVRQIDANGKLVGELRILGLYTSSAYIESPRAIPLVRQKLQAVVR